MRKFNKEKIIKLEKQIEEHKVKVDYDTKEYPVEVICQKYLDGIDNEENEIFIPNYQRDFIWPEITQSKFIESIMLDLPIPYIFVADNDGRLEIVDGVQRIRTIVAFLSNQLKIQKLKKLTHLNGLTYKDLLISRQRRFNRKTIRMIELTEKADETVRTDLFERINTGMVGLVEMEKRKGILSGPFYDVLLECAKLSLFKKLCPISAKKKKREEEAEMILRFFAYAANYQNFAHSVTEFLSDYMEVMNQKKSFKKEKSDFKNMLEFAKETLPNGFSKQPGATTTPRVRFEALSVGIHLALKEDSKLNTSQNIKWLESKLFRTHTRSDASNSRPKVKARIEYVRDKLLGNG